MQLTATIQYTMNDDDYAESLHCQISMNTHAPRRLTLLDILFVVDIAAAFALLLTNHALLDHLMLLLLSLLSPPRQQRMKGRENNSHRNASCYEYNVIVLGRVLAVQRMPQSASESTSSLVNW